MAFVNANLHLRAGAPGDLTYTYDATADTMATVATAGYFNNSDDDLNLTVDDLIWCQCGDGNMWQRVSALSSGSVTTQFAGGNIPIQTFATGSNAAHTQLDVGYYDIGTSIATATLMVLPVPYPGAEVFCIKADSGSKPLTFHSGGSATGGSTDIVFDAKGNRAITMRMEGECFHVVGSSTSRWRMMDYHYQSSHGSCASNGMLSYASYVHGS